MQVDPVFNKRTKSVGSGASVGSVGSAYLISDEFDEEASDIDSDSMADGDFAINTKSRLPQASDVTKNNPLSSHNTGQEPTIDCGLCGDRHGSGQCLMVDSSENLAEYREMLILHTDDEPWEERVRFFYSSNVCRLLHVFHQNSAIRAIDEILFHRNDIALIAGQPLHPFVKAIPGASTFKLNNSIANSQVGLSKQVFSSRPEKPRKKAKTVMAPMSSCPCNQTPHLKDCPLGAGSKK
jgi:hypothetical protein